MGLPEEINIQQRTPAWVFVPISPSCSATNRNITFWRQRAYFII